MPPSTFSCSDCRKIFSQRNNLNRHRRVNHTSLIQTYKCDTCFKEFRRREYLARHQRIHTSTAEFTCPQCLKKFTRLDYLTKHLKSKSACGTDSTQARNDNEDDECGNPCDFKSAVNDNVKTFTYKNKDHTVNHLNFKDGLKPTLNAALTNELTTMRGLKWYIAMKVKFSRTVIEDGEKIIETTPCFRSKCYLLLGKHDIEDQLNSSLEEITRHSWEFQREGSGWIEDSVVHMVLKIGKYTPLSASSYIPLPRKLELKKAIINIKNQDNKCFLWSIIAHLHPQNKHPQRVTKYMEYESQLNVKGIDFPVTIPKINVFEQNNNLSVNVYGYENELFPLRITKKQSKDHIDLLYISDGDKNHYCLIKNFNKLNFSLTKHGHGVFYCHYCLHRFSSKTLLEDHEPRCARNEPQKINMPSEDNKWMQFDKHFLKLKAPFVIYADFECFLQKVEGVGRDPSISSTSQLSHHTPSGFSYVVIDNEGKCFKKPVVYRGENVIDVFLQNLLNEEREISRIKKTVQPMEELSLEENEVFEKASNCHICYEVLGGDKVRDHCHISGKFRGAAHNACNLNFKYSLKVPIIIHNLKNYDSHLIIQGIGKYTDHRITCIPNNMEKYISFSLGNLQFIDSYQFLNTSLEQLVNNLKESNARAFSIMEENFDTKEMELLLRKGIFPYDYMNSHEKMIEANIPSKSSFFNVLTQNEISDKDYEHAVRVWKEFKISNIGEYHDLYVKTDTLLLADVFENFRKLALSYYEIDPAHLYTAPGFAWQAALKMTKVRLELLTDIDMHLFIESGIRGGVSVISKRHSIANNQYLDNHHPDKDSNFIIYLDCNNLYGYSMSESLPVSNFTWLKPHEISELEVNDIDNDGDWGYIMEVDLKYPKKLHTLHNCYPLAPEKMYVKENMLSPHSKSLTVKLGIKNSGKVSKLVPNLMDKEKYVIHYRNLKQYLELGLELVKVHRVIKFKQSKWLKPYIDFNTDKRKNARNDFEKDFFKLLNNSVFGKTMENLRNRVNVELVQNEKRIKKLIASPAFEGFQIFNDDLTAVKLKKKSLTLNRPIYCGFTILDLSKTLMYDFHYSFIKTKYGDKATLLFTDTDSLCYDIQTNDIYRDFKESRHLFDTSNYHKDHTLFDEKNKKRLGVMKDEMGGALVKEFVGLRPKMYSLLKASGDEKKVAKGVLKNTLKSKIKHAHYKNCLLNSKLISEDMFSIRSFKHNLFTIKQRKIALSPADDKRYILDDGITTLAYGHYSINQCTE